MPTTTLSTQDFWAYLMGNRFARRLALGAILVLTVAWICFKMAYPSPNLIFDSYHYIRAAILHSSVNAWPIGYSVFLGIFSYFSRSPLFLTSCQLLALGSALWWWYCSWLYLFRPGKKTSLVVFVLLFLNPMVYACANYIMSDCLFIAFSIAWITQLMWIVSYPKLRMIFTSALFVYLAYTFRYTAMYYPFVTVVAFILSRQPVYRKILGALAPIVLMVVFSWYTAMQTKRVCGLSSFSPFAGWKLANNALYVYARVPEESRVPVPVDFCGLDRVVRDYFDRSPHLNDTLAGDNTSGSMFMFFFSSPLNVYMYQLQGRDEAAFNSVKWMRMGPLYQQYGGWLIRHYPLSFLRYFVAPNLWHYFIPPPENYASEEGFYLREYLGGEYVHRLIDLPLASRRDTSILFYVSMMHFYPSLQLVLHLAFIFTTLVFLSKKLWRLVDERMRKLLILMGAFWVVDFLFSVLSSNIVLRYEIAMGVIEITLVSYFFSMIVRSIEAE